MGKRVIYFFAAAFLSTFLIAALSSACDTVCPLQRHASPWVILVEKSFGLPKGLGTVLMTLEEWEEQKKIMVGMTPQERQLYKDSMHLKLVEKAREKGIALSQAGPARELKKERDIVRPFVYASKSNGPVTE